MWSMRDRSRKGRGAGLSPAANCDTRTPTSSGDRRGVFGVPRETTRAPVRGRGEAVAPVAVGAQRAAASPAHGKGRRHADRAGTVRADRGGAGRPRAERGGFRQARPGASWRGRDGSPGGDTGFRTTGSRFGHRESHTLPLFMVRSHRFCFPLDPEVHLSPAGRRWRVQRPGISASLLSSAPRPSQPGRGNRSPPLERGNPRRRGAPGSRLLPGTVHVVRPGDARTGATLCGRLLSLQSDQPAQSPLLPNEETVVAGGGGRIPRCDSLALGHLPTALASPRVDRAPRIGAGSQAATIRSSERRARAAVSVGTSITYRP
jgi:hypothetical protein